MREYDSAQTRLCAFALMTQERMLKELELSAFGLSREQAEENRKTYGENCIVGQKKDTIRRRLRRSFVNPFSVVLFLLAVISFFTDVVFAANYSKNATTSVIMLSMLLVSGLVRFVQEMRAKKITDQLVGLVNTTVEVCRDGVWQEISSEQLVFGDRVRLKSGDRVPADIRLIRANDFFVNESVITGESGVWEKFAEPLHTEPTEFLDYTNTVFLGATVIGGFSEGVVLAVGKDTVYGGITPEQSARKHGYDCGENSIAWVLIRFMALLTPIVFLACGLTKGNWLEAFLFALSVAVGLTPELLPMVISACLAQGSYRMGQKQTVVKTINAMQGFGSMDTLCVDKTGTLTGDKIRLEYYMDVCGDMSQKTLDAAFLNSAYHTGVSNHLDKAILRMKEFSREEAYYSDLVDRYPKLDELPFDYSRRYSGVLVRGERTNYLLIKGSVVQVESRCQNVLQKSGEVKAGEKALESAHAVAAEMLADGMKVLAVAAKELNKDVLLPEDEKGLTLLGYLAFFDAPKKSAKSAIGQLKEQHIAVKVLTGDHADVALSVCKRIGIDTERILTGAQLDFIDDNELPVLAEKCDVYAELSPRQKSRIVEMLQNNGHAVGFMGDGMNDLPSVVQADVGISVDTATVAVKESADVILLKKDLNVLSEGVLEGRRAFTNMSKYIKITASSNFGNICAVVVASVFLPFFPMTTVQLLLLNLLYDILCLVMPWDNVDEELSENVRDWSGKNLGRFMVYFGLISSVFDISTFLFLYFVLCPSLCGGDFLTLAADGQALFTSLFQTGWFLESMWTQVLILQLLRTKKMPFIQSKPSRSLVIVTLLGIVLFSVLTVTSLGTLFGMTAMPVVYYVFLILTVIVYLLCVTLFKRLYIRKYHELI